MNETKHSIIEILADYKKLKSIPLSMQMDYWTIISRCMKNNPDLTYDFIKNSLLAKEEIANKETTIFTFRQ